MSTIKVRLMIYFFQPNKNGDWDGHHYADPIDGYLWKDIEWPFSFIPRPGEVIAASIVNDKSEDPPDNDGNFLVSSQHQIVHTRDFVQIPVWPSVWLHGQNCGVHIQEISDEFWMRSDDIESSVVSDWQVRMGYTTEDLNGLTQQQLLEKAFMKMTQWNDHQQEWEHSRVKPTTDE